MFFIMDIWTFITVKLIWGMFKLAWFLVTTLWWLLVLAIASAVVLVRRRHIPRDHPDAGKFLNDAEGELRWRSLATGTLYPVDTDAAGDTEECCEVQASEKTLGWDAQMTALNRLFRHKAAVFTSRFSAVTGDGRVAATADFPQETYRGMTLDHASQEWVTRLIADGTCDLRNNREYAVKALDGLEAVLGDCGWEREGGDGEHWYSRRCQRPVILWDQPLHAAEVPAIPAP